MKIYVIGLFFLLVMSSCLEIIYVILLSTHSEKKVIITKEYVINPNWDEYDNSFDVCRMLLKDSSKTIDLKKIHGSELYNNLIEDTTFTFTANVKYDGTPYSKRKVYFNKDNGFAWCDRNKIHSKCERRILGELQQKTWYMLAGLSNDRTLYYVYLDTLDSLHVFRVCCMTNY